MSEWIWIDPRVVIAAHEGQLAEHGGPGGIRDQGALESALARPRNLAAYEKPDAAALAAAYAFGIAKNHPFVDGNKRTALVALEVFLDLNGYSLGANDVECVLVIRGLAAGELSESDIANWVRKHIKPSE